MEQFASRVSSSSEATALSLPSPIFERMLANGSLAARTIQANWNRPIGDYLRDLLPRTRGVTPSPNQSLNLLTQELEDFIKLRYPEIEAPKALAQFQTAPVMQLADHANLLIDPDTFMNNFLHQIAGREAHHRYLFTQQCTSIRTITNKARLLGSLFLHQHLDVFKVFEGSMNRFVDSHVGTLGPVRISATALGAKELPPYAAIPPPTLLAPFIGQEFPDALSALHTINSEIWRKLPFRAKKILIQLDDTFTCDLVARHLESPNSPLRRILLEPEARQAFLSAKGALLKSPENLALQDTVDFFYQRQGEALVPLRVHPSEPVLTHSNNRNDHKAFISLNTEEISDGLRQRTLFPDLLTSYLALSVLPNCIALGGPSQQEYQPLLNKMLLAADERCRFLSDTDRTAIENQNVSRFCSSALIDLDRHQKAVLGLLNESIDFDQFERSFSTKTIGEALGGGSAYQYYQIFFDRRRTLHGELQ